MKNKVKNLAREDKRAKREIDNSQNQNENKAIDNKTDLDHSVSVTNTSVLDSNDINKLAKGIISSIVKEVPFLSQNNQ